MSLFKLILAGKEIDLGKVISYNAQKSTSNLSNLSSLIVTFERGTINLTITVKDCNQILEVLEKHIV